MAVLIDLSQTLIVGVMAHLNMTKAKTVDSNLVRHMSLNIIRGHAKQFKKEYGEVILCCDSRKYWRKDYFPLYKIHRKKNRDASPLDWEQIFGFINQIKSDLKEYFPYRVIEVDGAEADDVIAILAPRLSADTKSIIISSDKDFLQLQKYKNITQYNPITKKKMVAKYPEIELKTKILSGDKGDGIPNVLSPSDCFALDLRQKPLTAKKLEVFLNTDITDKNVPSEVYTHYMRNKTLIDFSYIPTNIKEKIVNTFEEVTPAPRMKLLNYLAEHNLVSLIESIEDF
jgi:5'-3' exonuclease